jgi:hypothetical protein
MLSAASDSIKQTGSPELALAPEGPTREHGAPEYRNGGMNERAISFAAVLTRSANIIPRKIRRTSFQER